MLRFLLKDLKLNAEDIEIKEKYGDISFNLQKISKKYNVEKEVLEKELIRQIESCNFIKRFEKQNDFINIYLDWQKLLSQFLDENVVEEKIIAEKILIEHTSANPNKALHIGHLRNACIGDCLYRFLKNLGNKVFVTSYIDDTGAQMAELLIAFKHLNRSLEIGEKFDIYCGKIYSEINKELERDENLRKIKSIIIKELESENSFTSELNKKVVEKVLKAQLETLWYFDIFFDFINKESDILNFGLWKETFEKLRQSKKIEFVEGKEAIEGLDEYSTSILKKKAGTYVIKSRDTYLVLIRSDGTTTYLAKDIAYAFWKHGIISKNFFFSEFVLQPNGKILYKTDRVGKRIEDFENFDISINVIGREQAENQYVIENLIKEFKNKKYVYYSYGLVFISGKVAKELGFDLEKKQVKMSGRKGLVVNVDDLVEKFEKKVREELKKRNFSNEELVRKIVKSCLRYEMIKSDRNRDLVFDFDEAIKLDGNTAMYLIYTYARISSLLKKFDQKDLSEKRHFECELNDYERMLARHILKFDQIISSTLKSLELHQLANYCYELAKTFNLFYENCRVIDEADSDKKEFRKVIVLLTKKLLNFLFDVLGIEKIEKI